MIPGGRHYVFLTNEREVEMRVRRFLQAAPTPSRPRASPRLSGE